MREWAMRRPPGLNSQFELVAESRRGRVVPHARGVRSSFRRRGRSCGFTPLQPLVSGKSSLEFWHEYAEILSLKHPV